LFTFQCAFFSLQQDVLAEDIIYFSTAIL
jgi:hypothetical protein